MAIFDDNISLLREISAQKTLTDSFPKFNQNKKLDDMKKKAGESKAMKLVKDILKIVAGAQAIRAIVIATLARDLPKIERFIKSACKTQLKELINCNNDPEIPDYLKNTGAGINIELRNTDFFGLFTMDPLSEEGALVYQDATSGLNSKDMHTFIYNTLQTENTPQDWGLQTMNNPIMTITYSATTPTDSNILNIKASQYYSDNKTLTDFNNDYIDSLELLPTAQMFNQLIDSLLGSISFKVKLPAHWIKKQEEVNKIIEKMMEVNENTVIDESFFQFNNEDLWDIETIAKNRSKGIREFVTCDNIPSSVDFSLLQEASNDIEAASTKQELETAIDKALTVISDEVAANANNKDKLAFKVEFFDAIFKAIGMNIANTVLSPKLTLLFQINHKLVYGENSPSFDTPSDYIFKNRVLFNAIFKAIVAILLTILIAYALKKLNELMLKSKAKDTAERAKLLKFQIIALLGISPALIKLINSIKI